EIQSTLLPFIQSRTVELGPGIKERFEMAAAITLAEAGAARAVRVEIADPLLALISIGPLIVLPTMPTRPPERDIPDGASFSEFRAQTLGFTSLARHSGLPQVSGPAGQS